jgi:hypothetical protein
MLAILTVIGTVMYRESMWGIFLRATMQYMKGHGGATDDLVHGLRLMSFYATGTSLYSVGSVVLVGLLAIWRLPRVPEKGR